MIYHRHFITFIEILMIITILILTLGLIGVNIRDLVKQQRFKSEVALVVDQLRLAQDLMLVLNTDAIVKFWKEGNGINYHVNLESVLSKGWQKELSRTHSNLKAITIIEFDDTGSGVKKAGLPLDLNFLSGGSVMSQGTLRFAAEGGGLEAYICLPGYPRPIVNITDPKNDPNCNTKVESDLFDKLTFYTRREIESRMPSNAAQGK
jgi:hypothetical protein